MELSPLKKMANNKNKKPDYLELQGNPAFQTLPAQVL
jgi:hypothetical protein